MEKWQENLEKARHHFKVADHMIYVTFPLLKENRLMIKVLSEMYESVNYLITALLQYAYSIKRIPLYKDPNLNLKTFKEKIGPVYLNKEELENIINILKIWRKHREAPLEFVKKEKFVILLNDKYETLTMERLKEFRESLKKLLVHSRFD